MTDDTTPASRTGVSRYFDYEGPVHYIDYGGKPDGPLVVCVHGLGGSAISFDLIARLLAAECRIYAIDLSATAGPPCWDARRQWVPVVASWTTSCVRSWANPPS